MNIRGLIKKRTTLRPSVPPSADYVRSLVEDLTAVRAAVSATSDPVGGAAAGPSIPLVTISEIEDAINVWRNRKPSSEDGAALCFEAHKLADVYGVMIVTHKDEVELASLTEEQRSALTGVFA